MKKKITTNLAGHQRKCRLDHFVGEGLRSPNQLRGIDFQGRQDSGNDADQHRRQQNVAAWILHFFRKSRNPIEANVSKHGDGCALEDSAEVKGLWVVKRLSKESHSIVAYSPKGARHEDKKDDDH